MGKYVLNRPGPGTIWSREVLPGVVGSGESTPLPAPMLCCLAASAVRCWVPLGEHFGLYLTFVGSPLGGFCVLQVRGVWLALSSTCSSRHLFGTGRHGHFPVVAAAILP